MTNQSPWVTGVTALARGYAALATRPDELASSGSPGNGPKSNMTGTDEDADADTLCVIVGTIHSGGFSVAGVGSFTPATWSCGCSV